MWLGLPVRGEWDRPKLIQRACAQQAAVREDGRPFWAGGRAGGHLWPLDLPPVMSSAWCLPSRPPLQSELITALPPRAVWRMRHKYGACSEHSLNLGCGDAKPPRDTEISWQSHCSHCSRPQTSRGMPAPPTERRQGLDHGLPTHPTALAPSSLAPRSFGALFRSRVHILPALPLPEPPPVRLSPKILARYLQIYNLPPSPLPGFWVPRAAGGVKTRLLRQWCAPPSETLLSWKATWSHSGWMR